MDDAARKALRAPEAPFVDDVTHAKLLDKLIKANIIAETTIGMASSLTRDQMVSAIAQIFDLNCEALGCTGATLDDLQRLALAHALSLEINQPIVN